MANDHEGGASQRDLFLFQHLVLMFQTLALQQLGKIVSPITGKMERDLRQARITIDMLQMLQRSTAGNIGEMEKRLLDTAVLELQMNYVDESKRPAGSGGEEDDESAGDEQSVPPGDEKPAEGRAADEDDPPAGTETQPDAGDREKGDADGNGAGTRR